MIDESTHSLSWDFDPESDPGSQGEGTTHSGQDSDTLSGQQDNVSDNLLELLATIWKDKKLREELCSLKGTDARLMINYLYSVLSKPRLPEPWHRRHYTIALYKLCKASQQYPHCYTLKESIKTSDSRHPSQGRYSDILKGKFGETELCLKLMRVYKRDLGTMLKIYAKEAILWGQLNHPNITIFYGIYYLDNKRDQVCLVSPWMRNGNLAEYLKDKPCVPRVPFIHDVASGLSYLHGRGLVHSDLKGTNILVNEVEQACITDFGVSFIHTENTLAGGLETSTEHACDPRWAAPELLEENERPTMASDMWAFGCVCSEILTGNEPYHDLKDSKQITYKLMGCKPPTRPTSEPLFRPSDKVIWDEVDRCWSVSAETRPKSWEVLEKLEQEGLSRGGRGEAQYDTEQKRGQLRDEMRADPKESPNLKAVKQILNKLCNPKT